MRVPFIKICGLSTEESVDRAVQAGADAIGFVFATSVRQVNAERARALAHRVPHRVETVGVFRGHSIDEVLDIARRSGVSTIQFHGGEPLSDLRRAQEAGFRTLRAFGIDEYVALSEHERELWNRERLLIDAVEPGGGVPFDPQQLSGNPLPEWWLLAGGLTPGNVTEVMHQLKPSGVDVSSGVESSRGVKSPELIEFFIEAARQTR